MAFVLGHRSPFAVVHAACRPLHAPHSRQIPCFPGSPERGVSVDRARRPAAGLVGLVRRLPEGAEVLEAKGDVRWLKGNLHTHTHWSDGDDYRKWSRCGTASAGTRF